MNSLKTRIWILLMSEFRAHGVINWRQFWIKICTWDWCNAWSVDQFEYCLWNKDQICLSIYRSVINHLSSLSIHSSVHPSVIHPSIFCFFCLFVLLVLLTRPQLLLPGGASGKESASQCRRLKSFGFNPWVWKIAWRRLWQSTLVFLPGESHGQRSLAGYSP